MEWTVIVTLIAQYGIPFVEKIILNAENKTPVTQDEWNILRALAKNDGVSMLKAALSRNGIPETEPRAAELIKLAESASVS